MIEPVKGVDALNRAFAAAGADMQRDLKTRLAGYAEPVRRDAENLALGIDAGVQWSRMRKGATRTLVYVAPVARGTRLVSRKRPKFARRLLSRAMEPALEANRSAIEAKIDAFLLRLERKFNRG